MERIEAISQRGTVSRTFTEVKQRRTSLAPKTVKSESRSNSVGFIIFTYILWETYEAFSHPLIG